jgi:hypothetical protein
MPDLRARHLRAPACAAAVLAAALAARADTIVLLDGDRITGKSASQPGGMLRVTTAYGRLVIPKGRIEKIVHEDGREEVLNEPPPPPLPPPKEPEPVHLVLAITGKTFWQAWDAKGGGAPADPSLRLEVRLDDDVVASYVDSSLDTGEIPKAVVNAFSFAPDVVAVTPGPGVRVQPPEVRPSRIQLELVLPPSQGGQHRLRLAYQANEGSKEAPSWRDLVESAVEIEIKAEGQTVVQVAQDRGTMEFSQHHMKNVATFRIDAQAE